MTTGCDDLVAGLEGILTGFEFLLLLTLGADGDEVEDDEDEHQRDDHLHTTSFGLLCGGLRHNDCVVHSS